MPEVDALTGADRAAWDAAIAFYRAEAIQRDLLFDDRMYALKQALAAIEDADGEWPADVDPGFEAALRSALPVYGAKFWPAHDYQNRVWIDEAVALLERFEEPLAERMMAAYGGAWPAEGVRVDVCAYANWAGAYTTGGPAHVTLSSGDPQGHGHGALELLMHEASHTRAMFRSFREELDAAVAARGAQAPRDLWHLFMFVTAGEVTRRTLADAGIAYTTYGERSGVYERGLSVALVPTVLREWGGYLAGEVSRDEALARIADAVHEL